MKEFEKPAGLTGSFWSVVWSPDSARVATAGGDKKVRIWDRESGAQVAEGLVGSGLQDMQVGLQSAGIGRLSECLNVNNHVVRNQLMRF